MSKKVFWSYTIGDGSQPGSPKTDTFPDEFYEAPAKYRSGYDMQYDHARCPAWKKYTDNSWVVKQPFDVGFNCNTKDGKLATDLTQLAYDQYFHLGQGWLRAQYPEIQMKYSIILWTMEKDVWVEQLPHPLLSRVGLELIPATFPISVWHRPMVVGVKILDLNQNLMLKKGTPLYIFRLLSKHGDHEFILEKKEPPAEWHRLQRQQNILREFAPFKSWDIITKRLENKEKRFRCPFKWN
jgi:hypothetical protein